MKKLFFLTLFIGVYFFSIAQTLEVPSYFSKMPKKRKAIQYAIGISDPKLDKQTAKKQAIYRAKMILALLNNTNVMQAKDLFTAFNEIDNNSKIEKMCRFKSNHLIDTSFIQIVKSDFNNFGEAIVLIMLIKPKTDTASFIENIKFEIDNYSRFVEHTHGYDNYREYKIKSVLKNQQNDSITMSYDFNDNDSEAYITSIFNDSTFLQRGTIYEYKANINDFNISDYQGFSSCRKGLWKAYIDAILKSLIINSDLSLSKQKITNDVFTSENVGSKIENLARSASNNLIKSNINSIVIHENKLYLNLKVLSITNK